MAGGITGIVAGSGIELAPLLDTVSETRDFSDFPELPPPSIDGHAGKFVRGLCGDTEVVLQAGRLHVYEGLRAGAAAATVDTLRALGAERIIFTNAAGALNPSFRAGTLMSMTSAAPWPSQLWPDAPETLTPAFRLQDESLHTGTYLWVHGPCYETPAEIHAMRQWGADAVGMSTAPELMRCAELGIPSAAVSCITNVCGAAEKLTHAHVVETARRASERLCGVIRKNLQPG